MKNKMTFGILATIALSASISFQAEAAATPLSTATAAGEQLKKETSSFVSTTNAGDIYAIDETYGALNSKLKNTEAAIGKVPGASVRKKLIETYVMPAKRAKERVIYEVSQIRLMGSISQSVIFKEEDKAALDLQKLDRLKNRAVEIKKSGGYPAVPASAVKELSWLENYLENAAVNPFYRNSEKVVLFLDNDAVSKQAIIGGIKIGDPKHKIELMLGTPHKTYSYGMLAYDYSKSAYGGEKAEFELSRYGKVSSISYTASAGKSETFTKEFIDGYPGSLYEATDAFEKENYYNYFWVLSGSGKDFVYLENSKDEKTGLPVNNYSIQDINNVTFFSVNDTNDFTRIEK